MLKKQGDWMELGCANQQKSFKVATVEAWGCSEKHPVVGWFGMYPPLLMEKLRFSEATHEAKGNKMRVK
ncbi:MAG: DUF6855 family protein [Bacteroidia bacterium]